MNGDAGDGGGIFSKSNSVFQGMAVVPSTITLDHATVAENNADEGGGLYVETAAMNTVAHTIFGDNTAATAGPDCLGQLFAPVYSLIEDTNGCLITGMAMGNLLNADPVLGPLQLNGRPTETHALLSGSPAVDAGDPTFMAPPGPDADQRGAARVEGPRIDIGAFEFNMSTVGPCTTNIDIAAFNKIAPTVYVDQCSFLFA